MRRFGSDTEERRGGGGWSSLDGCDVSEPKYPVSVGECSCDACQGFSTKEAGAVGFSPLGEGTLLGVADGGSRDTIRGECGDVDICWDCLLDPGNLMAKGSET